MKELNPYLKQDVQLSSSDKKIRENWKHAFFIYYLGTCLLLLAAMALNSMFDLGLDPEAIRIALFSGLGFAMIQGGLMYLFAYKQRGTKWIGWFVFTSPIGTVVEIIKLIPTAAIVWIFNIIFLLPYVYFWIHSKKLYDLNHILKRRTTPEIQIVS